MKTCTHCNIAFEAGPRAKFCSKQCSFYASSKLKEGLSEDDCWEWNGAINSNGYGIFYFRGNSFGAHRFSATLAFGKMSPSIFACHRCDNPPCINPKHLFMGTHLDNVNDAVAKGRPLLRGEKISRAKSAKGKARKRIDVAKHAMLDNPSLKIQDAAMIAGYATYKSLNKAFMRLEGTTTSGWRKNAEKTCLPTF